jgi:hypothetical protein
LRPKVNVANVTRSCKLSASSTAVSPNAARGFGKLAHVLLIAAFGLEAIALSPPPRHPLIRS